MGLEVPAEGHSNKHPVTLFAICEKCEKLQMLSSTSFSSRNYCPFAEPSWRFVQFVARQQSCIAGEVAAKQS